jgi:hypothetical protein
VASAKVVAPVKPVVPPKAAMLRHRNLVAVARNTIQGFGIDELRKMPSETRVATLECAGNSRVFLVPQVQGAQWELGAVSNAEWTGVPLRALLERVIHANRAGGHQRRRRLHQQRHRRRGLRLPPAPIFESHADHLVSQRAVSRHAQRASRVCGRHRHF